MNKRHDFNAKTKATLAKRVGFRCSNPNCKRLTSGPSAEKDKSVNIGVAAHIIPASKDGPRAENASSEQRKSITNGIWLCQTCSVLIDRDPIKFDKNLLYKWKKIAEESAEKELDSTLSIDYYFYNGVFFRSKLHTIWAAFFDEIDWHYSYENNHENILTPNFLLRTHCGDEFQVYIINKKEFTLDYRLKIGEATNYAGNLLILYSNPFTKHKYSCCNNIIGLSSVEGKTRNSNGQEDFEFCTAVISSCIPTSIGTNIHNLCTLESIFHDLITEEESFCLDLWKKAKLIIG